MIPIDLGVLRLEMRAWLRENVPQDLRVPPRGEELGPDLEAWTLEFRRKLGERGWLAPSWPTYFGGGGLPTQVGAVIMDEMQRVSLPPLGLNMTWLLPLRVWGTEEQKARWLPPTLRGEITVYHIFSEPSNGTDLASQATTAKRDGDEYVVNGEKGHIGAPITPDYLMILVTIDPEAPKYENLGMVIVNARDPGVTVKYRRMITGGTLKSFVINDVRVPVEDVIGPETGGWQVAQTLLDLERGGKGITMDQREEIERRERAFWSKFAK